MCAHQDKCVGLCVYMCVSVLGEFGIAQHGLGNAVETAAVFCKTMITSCPASAASPPPPPRGLCVGVCLQICVASLHMERNAPCIRFFRLVKGFPSFTWDRGKSRSPWQQRHNADTLKLNSVCVIRQKMGAGTHTFGEIIWQLATAAHWFILSCFIHLKLWIFIPESAHFARIYCVLHGDPSCRVAE